MSRALALIGVLMLGDCSAGQASDAEVRRFVDRGGALAAAETSVAAARGRYTLHHVRLVSTTGLAATGRLLRPTGAEPARRLPAVLLANGRELNSRAIEHLPAVVRRYSSTSARSRPGLQADAHDPVDA